MGTVRPWTLSGHTAERGRHGRSRWPQGHPTTGKQSVHPCPTSSLGSGRQIARAVWTGESRAIQCSQDFRGRCSPSSPPLRPERCPPPPSMGTACPWASCRLVGNLGVSMARASLSAQAQLHDTRYPPSLPAAVGRLAQQHLRGDVTRVPEHLVTKEPPEKAGGSGLPPPSATFPPTPSAGPAASFPWGRPSWRPVDLSGEGAPWPGRQRPRKGGEPGHPARAALEARTPGRPPRLGAAGSVGWRSVGQGVGCTQQGCRERLRTDQISWHPASSSAWRLPPEP